MLYPEFLRLILIGTLIHLTCLSLLAQEVESSPLTLLPEWEAQVFASEPMLANPVALSVSEKDAVFVTETRRRKVQNLDIRSNPDWIEQELALKSVEEKELFYKRTLSQEHSSKNSARVEDLNKDGYHDWRDLTVLSDVLHALTDEDGDGRADLSSVFAEGFNTPVTGVAAGVMAYRNTVYLTITPNVWTLKDRDHDGKADFRQTFSTGFGVHVAYAGHNLHGLIQGPDGRIYWSVGDNGSNYLPHEGAVFRCEPDGSGFEVYAKGLRNPQEIAFNELGDLFTADNDGDFGDRERWYYLVDGGDYGWKTWWQYQIGKQWGASEHTYSTWNEEKLWHKAFPGQAAYIIPAIEYVAGGPCGMVFNSGSLLGTAWRNTFLVAHFTGSTSNSGIWAYQVSPNGADYSLDLDRQVIGGLVPTGVDMSWLGDALYLADWSGGWALNNAGKVWKIKNKETRTPSDVIVKKLLASPAGLDPVQLRACLNHESMRIRMEAQFELAQRGSIGFESLLHTVKTNTSQKARLHALWGIGMMGRKEERFLPPLIDFLKDPDEEIRAQTAKVLGEARYRHAAQTMLDRLNDAPPRERYHLAMALGKMQYEPALHDIITLISDAGEDRRMLRHAGIMALTRIYDRPFLSSLIEHPSPDVRLAAVVALRKKEDPAITAFLEDPDPLVVLEVARAINDIPIEAGRPLLAEKIIHLGTEHYQNEALIRRILNAVYRMGSRNHAAQLAQFATLNEATDGMRLEAMRMLALWEKPSPRDRVAGGWFLQARPNRPLSEALDAFRNVLPRLLLGPPEIKTMAAEMADQWQLSIDQNQLFTWLEDPMQPVATRVSALQLIWRQYTYIRTRALNVAFNSEPDLLRKAAMELQAESEPQKALEKVKTFLAGDRLELQQASIRLLPSLPGSEALELLSDLLLAAKEDTIHPALKLDVFQAASQLELNGSPGLLDLFSFPVENSPLLYGGDYEKGQSLFRKRTDLQCLRCHSAGDMQGMAGGNVAPDLAGIGTRKKRAEILEGIIYPNASFAEGFEQVRITLNSGKIRMGRVIERTDSTLKLEIPSDNEDGSLTSGEVISIDHATIELEEPGLSAMPEGLAYMMTPEELRHLMEYLARQ